MRYRNLRVGNILCQYPTMPTYGLAYDLTVAVMEWLQPAYAVKWAAEYIPPLANALNHADDTTPIGAALTADALQVIAKRFVPDTWLHTRAMHRAQYRDDPRYFYTAQMHREAMDTLHYVRGLLDDETARQFISRYAPQIHLTRCPETQAALHMMQTPPDAPGTLRVWEGMVLDAARPEDWIADMPKGRDPRRWARAMVKLEYWNTCANIVGAQIQKLV